MTLSHLERRDTKGQLFWMISVINARTVWRRTTEYAVVTFVERGVSRAQIQGIRGKVPVSPNFWDPIPLHTKFRPRTTKFDTLTHMEEMCVSRGQPRPILGGSGPSVPKILQHTAEKQQQNFFARWSNWMREKFYRVDHVPCPGQNFRDMNANARYVCAS